MTRPTPVFEAPWHAQLFALTVHLNETGHFSWPDWAEAFGETLRRHGHARALDGGDDYFAAWLETLETILAQDQSAPRADIETHVSAWRRAYLHTPHGQPVHLPG